MLARRNIIAVRLSTDFVGITFLKDEIRLNELGFFFVNGLPCISSLHREGAILSNAQVLLQNLKRISLLKKMGVLPKNRRFKENYIGIA